MTEMTVLKKNSGEKKEKKKKMLEKCHRVTKGTLQHAFHGQKRVPGQQDIPSMNDICSCLPFAIVFVA